MTPRSGVHLRYWLIAAALLVAILVWLALGDTAAPADLRSARPPVAVALAARPIVNDAPMQTRAKAGRVAADGACLGTALHIAGPASGETVDECLGAPSSEQNGDIRRNQFSAASGWSLAALN